MIIERLKAALPFLIARLKEPSSLSGLAGLAGLYGVSGATFAAYSSALAVVFGLLAVVLPERGDDK